MLSPRYLDGLADDITEIYSLIETEILQDMARRIARLGKITEATEWQGRMLAEAGGLKKDIGRILAKYDKSIIAQVQKTVTDALKKNTANDNRIFKAYTGRTVSEPNAQMMLSTIQKCHSDLSRLTLTTAATSERQFVAQANRAYMMTQSGAFDYDTAMKYAADDLSHIGITTVHYDNGKPVVRSIESAVRMNILTSINQTAANITLNNAEELGVDRFEVSAHIGARPEHKAWQGKIYTKEQLTTICGLGDVTGLCGINCRHSFYPYFEGTDKHYSQDDLDEMASEKVKFTDKGGNEKEVTRYQGEQYLRKIERNVRFYKRRAALEEATGGDNTASLQLVGKWQAEAREFTKQTGIARDYAHEWVATPTGKQPKGITPAVAGYSDNLKKAQDIKRLDNARNKIIADIPQGKPMNFQQADGGAPNPNFKKGGGYTKNCQTSVVAYELRRRGYDVEALPNYKGSMLEVLSHDTRLAWVDRQTGKNPNFIIPDQPTVQKSFDWIKAELKPKNRYTIQFQWKGRQAAHIVHIFKNTEGKLSIYDPQNGINTLGDNAVLEYLKQVRPTTIKLLDVQNYDINMNVVNKILQGMKK